MPGLKNPPESRPDPDPTVRTIEQQQRENANLKEFLGARIDSVEGDLDRVQTILDLLPAGTDAKLAKLQELLDVKGEGIADQFTMRDIALAAALKAAQEIVKAQNDSNAIAADKAAAAVTKLMDSLVERLDSFKEGTDKRIDELKERISELNRTDWSAIGGYVVGAVGILAAVAVIVTRH